MIKTGTITSKKEDRKYIGTIFQTGVASSAIAS